MTLDVQLMSNKNASLRGLQRSPLATQHARALGTFAPTTIRPIFILSLPRTGSTLLQRILGSHEAIGTASEPWFLLPLFYALRELGVQAEYEHTIMARSVRGFADEYLPNGVNTYLDAVHDLALRLYAEAAPAKPYFLDKTPRYHHIASDLLRLFPEGRFIFLWRHPLAIAASMIETYGSGCWNLDTFSADLFRGLPALVDTYRKGENRVASVRYEDLVTRPFEEIDRLLRYLELPADETVLTRFREVPMNPEFSDPTGMRAYDRISVDPLNKWKQTMANPFRKAWCRRYLHSLGEGRLTVMGYSLPALLAEVDAVRSDTKHVASDLAHAGTGAVRRSIRSRIVRAPFPLWRSAASRQSD
jgi:hypothetical protein